LLAAEEVSFEAWVAQPACNSTASAISTLSAFDVLGREAFEASGIFMMNFLLEGIV
jgi:hypothetical protein